nr:Chain B, Rab11-FIP2 GPF peptide FNYESTGPFTAK [synthetic construct]
FNYESTGPFTAK